MAGRRRIRVLDTRDVLAHEVAVIPAEFDARQPVQVVGIGAALEAVFPAHGRNEDAHDRQTRNHRNEDFHARQHVFRLIELGQTPTGDFIVAELTACATLLQVLLGLLQHLDDGLTVFLIQHLVPARVEDALFALIRDVVNHHAARADPALPVVHVDEVEHPGAVVAHPQTVVIEVVVRVRRRLPTRHVLACQHEHIHRIRAFNAVANGADFGDFVRREQPRVILHLRVREGDGQHEHHQKETQRQFLYHRIAPPRHSSPNTMPPISVPTAYSLPLLIGSLPQMRPVCPFIM